MSAVRGVSLMLAGLLMGVAAAADYDPPQGFNAHPWGESLTAVPGLVLWQANTATGYPGKVTEFQMRCTEDPPGGNSCNYLQAEMVQRVEGAGSFAVAEYYRRNDSNPWQASGVGLVGVTYLYCASGLGNHLPSPLRKHLSLCGARAYFSSDSDAIKAQLGPNHETNYDRLMRRLVADHGLPAGFVQRGSITIDTVDEQPPEPELAAGGEQLTVWRWCGLKLAGRELKPRCPATVTLVFDRGTGNGMVLYATEPMYGYAWARHDMNDPDNELYLLLTGQIKPEKRNKTLRECTGSRNCGSSNQALQAKRLAEFQP